MDGNYGKRMAEKVGQMKSASMESRKSKAMAQKNRYKNKKNAKPPFKPMDKIKSYTDPN